MGEALAVASSVSGLLSLAITVADASFRCISNVRNASSAIQAYFRELSALKKVLVQIDDLTHNPEIRYSLPRGQLFLQTVAGVDECCKELERLRQKLQKRTAGNAFSTSFNRLSWPFAEEETRGIVETLHRYRGIFQTTLSADGLYVLLIFLP